MTDIAGSIVDIKIEEYGEGENKLTVYLEEQEKQEFKISDEELKVFSEKMKGV